MSLLEIIFWILIGLVFYSYVGYGLVLYILVTIKRLFIKEMHINEHDHPEVTLLIPAFNEKNYVYKKIENSLALNYPKNKIKHLWVTDGSDDGTPDLLKQYSEVKVLHQTERNGKIAAMNRAMKYVDTPIVIFSDANTLLGIESINKIVKLFCNPKTGCVSGEKRIFKKDHDAAAGSGEGIYWKYESTLKKWDAELNSVVGAAGELFAIRTELFEEVEKDTILDDFIISLRVAMKGYKIKYDPEAYAIETSSLSVKEELKRKIRIAAGGFQSIARLLPLLNIFKYGLLSFQYISHRLLRWTVAPIALFLIIMLNIFLINVSPLYNVLILLQLLFYSAALIGWILENQKIKIKALFVPYYFAIMNYAMFAGFVRFVKNNQSVNWERAKRG